MEQASNNESEEKTYNMEQQTTEPVKKKPRIQVLNGKPFHHRMYYKTQAEFQKAWEEQVAADAKAAAEATIVAAAMEAADKGACVGTVTEDYPEIFKEFRSGIEQFSKKKPFAIQWKLVPDSLGDHEAYARNYRLGSSSKILLGEGRGRKFIMFKRPGIEEAQCAEVCSTDGCYRQCNSGARCKNCQGASKRKREEQE